MENDIWIEVLGYVGMAFVVISFLFKNVKFLRLFNLIGSIFSATYGILTKTYPTMALNLILALINFSMPVAWFIKDKHNKKNSNKVEFEGSSENKDKKKEN